MIDRQRELQRRGDTFDFVCVIVLTNNIHPSSHTACYSRVQGLQRNGGAGDEDSGRGGNSGCGGVDLGY